MQALHMPFHFTNGLCTCMRGHAVDVPGHLEDILAAKPRAVWLQSGIRAPEVEEALAQAGIWVVADRCLLVEHQATVANRM